jgi:hypothetical protein
MHSKKSAILIVTVADDLHALAIQDYIVNSQAKVDCVIIESDKIASQSELTWSNLDPSSASILANNGQQVLIKDLDVIWWRRIGKLQHKSESLSIPQADLVNADCAAGLRGILQSVFTGSWVSTPQATSYASNKLVQLQAAMKAGLRIPRTLVTQNLAMLREFIENSASEIIVKPVIGTLHAPIMTTFIDTSNLPSSSTIALCPAIYQEYIPGEKHLRVCCFGNTIVAAEIRSANLDWRYDSKFDVNSIEIAAALKNKLQNVLSELGLRMGIFDIKLDANNEPCWLEVNSQGQFLFLEGLCGLPLTKIAGDFFIAEAGKYNNRIR